MQTEPAPAKAAEADIQSAIDRWADAIRRKDAGAVLACLTSDAVIYELAPPLQANLASAEGDLNNWFATWRGPIGYHLHNLEVAAAADIAYAHGLCRLTGGRTDDTETDVWFRVTLGLRRSAGRWLIAHVHESVPFYKDGTTKAAVDLRP